MYQGIRLSQGRRLATIRGSPLPCRSQRSSNELHTQELPSVRQDAYDCTYPSLEGVALERIPGDFADQAKQQFDRLRASGAQLWRSYEGQLTARPVQTKALTSMVGLALGDVIAQASTGCFDPMRTARMAAFGAALHGPAGHYWYRLLDTYVMPNRGTAPSAIVTKMVLDQALFAPLFTAIFYATLTALEGRPEAIAEVVSTRLVPTVLSGYALWPLAHLVSFKFVPSEYRLLYINAVNLVWTVHLSKLASAPMVVCDDPTNVAALLGTSPPASFNNGYTAIPVSSSADMVFTPPEPTMVHHI